MYSGILGGTPTRIQKIYVKCSQSFYFYISRLMTCTFGIKDPYQPNN